MADWNLELTIVSAANLVNVRNFGLMKVYAQVSINEDQDQTYKSPVDYNGEENPVWNFRAPYSITNEDIKGDEYKIVVKLYCERTFGDDKYVGEVNVSLKALFQFRNNNGGFGEFDVERVNENGEFGAVILSYCFVEIIQPTKVDTSIQSSAVQEKEASIVSGVIQAAALGAVQGLVEMFIPGSSIIFELFQE